MGDATLSLPFPVLEVLPEDDQSSPTSPWPTPLLVNVPSVPTGLTQHTFWPLELSKISFPLNPFS